MSGDTAALSSRLADREAIREVIVRYAQGVDQREWPLYASAFAAEAVVEVPGFLDRPVSASEFAEVLAGEFDDARLSGQHHLGIPLIDLTGPDTARAVTEFIAVNASRAVSGPGDDRRGAVTTQQAAGIYIDSVVRGPRGWRIAHRTLVQKTDERDVVDIPGAVGAPRNPAVAIHIPRDTDEEATVPLTVQELSDRAEIHDVLSAYAHAQDQNAWHLYDRVFTATATIDLPGTGIGSLTAEQLKAFLRDDFDATRLSGQHLIGNVLVEIAGDRARSAAEVLHVTLQHTEAEGRLLVTKGTSLYLDDWERAADGWRIAHRTAVQKHTETSEKDYPLEQIAAIAAGQQTDPLAGWAAP